MRQRIINLLENRTRRHIFFWICWVFGFTFIKSFGEPGSIYFGWFSYYILTLPIFITHTYLIAYLLIPTFLTKKYYPLFILLFLGFFYGFSVTELIFSNELIFRWVSTGSEIPEHYLSPGSVIISGLGNLYIVLVFLAAKTIRDWYLADNKRKELQQTELRTQVEDAIIRVQPFMLLYAIDHIDRLVDLSSPDVTEAIATTSDLLSEVMIHHSEKRPLFSKEIELVKKLIKLAELFRGSKPDVEFFIAGDPGQIKLPPMILFSFVDLIIRRFDKEQSLPEMNIEASGYSNMITIQILNSGDKRNDETSEECLHTIQQLESSYGDRVSITMETHSYGCSVIIMNSEVADRNTIHTETNAVDTT